MPGPRRSSVVSPPPRPRSRNWAPDEVGPRSQRLLVRAEAVRRPLYVPDGPCPCSGIVPWPAGVASSPQYSRGRAVEAHRRWGRSPRRCSSGSHARAPPRLTRTLRLRRAATSQLLAGRSGGRGRGQADVLRQQCRRRGLLLQQRRRRVARARPEFTRCSRTSRRTGSPSSAIDRLHLDVDHLRPEALAPARPTARRTVVRCTARSVTTRWHCWRTSSPSRGASSGLSWVLRWLPGRPHRRNSEEVPEAAVGQHREVPAVGRRCRRGRPPPRGRTPPPARGRRLRGPPPTGRARPPRSPHPGRPPSQVPRVRSPGVHCTTPPVLDRARPAQRDQWPPVHGPRGRHDEQLGTGIHLPPVDLGKPQVVAGRQPRAHPVGRRRPAGRRPRRPRRPP